MTKLENLRMRKDQSRSASMTPKMISQQMQMIQPEETYGIQSNKRKKCLFYPFDKSKQIWDLVIGVCLIVSCLTIPAYLALYFEYESELPSSRLINQIVDVCFFIDILVTFNTAVPVSQVKIVEDRKEIARMYLRQWFWIDVAVTMPYD